MQVIQELFEGKRREDHLSDGQLEYLRMVRAVYGMLLDVKAKKYIVGALMQQFNISQNWAYTIIRETEILHGDINKVNKDMERHIAIEMAKEAYRKAKHFEDVREMINATKAYIVAAGLDKESIEIPDFSKMEPSLVIAVLPNNLEKKLLEQINKGVVDLNNFEEAEYEQVETTRKQG